MSTLISAFFVIEQFNRCSEYRGSTVDFASCLNLSQPQFVASTNPHGPTLPSTAPSTPFAPKSGPHPAIPPRPGQTPAGGFIPAQVPKTSVVPVHIMSNPNRARSRGGSHGSHAWQSNRQPTLSDTVNENPNQDAAPVAAEQTNGSSVVSTEAHRDRGRGRGAFASRGRARGILDGAGASRGRGGHDRGGFRRDSKGGARGGFRGRTRGLANHAAVVATE